MKIHYALSTLAVFAKVQSTAAYYCLGDCTISESGGKECVFTAKLDLHAGELGYYYFEECGDEVNPTLGIEKGVTYRFIQQDLSNYYHPLGLAYYPDGAHADVDELEPGIAPPGSSSDCEEDLSCPAPMYIKDSAYLGEYSNNENIAPITGSEDFGLDFYEPEFFLDPYTWLEAGTYEIALLFDVDDFTDDIFYFCHIHQFMTGRIKFVNSEGTALSPEDNPAIEYDYDVPSEYDQSCGTHGLGDFQLPHPECPEEFVCNKPEDSPAAKFGNCLDSMNCAMAVGMTTNVNHDVIALFNHQMIPHHQNAVNMCKALLASGGIRCEDLLDEDDAHCVMTLLCHEIINGQNFQIQTMRGILESLEYPQEDDCKVEIKSRTFDVKSSKSPKASKSPKVSKSQKASKSPKM